MNVTIRNVDEVSFRAFKARAALRRINLGQAMGEAIHLWLGLQVDASGRSLGTGPEAAEGEPIGGAASENMPAASNGPLWDGQKTANHGRDSLPTGRPSAAGPGDARDGSGHAGMGRSIAADAGRDRPVGDGVALDREGVTGGGLGRADEMRDAAPGPSDGSIAGEVRGALAGLSARSSAQHEVDASAELAGPAAAPAASSDHRDLSPLGDLIPPSDDESEAPDTVGKSSELAQALKGLRSRKRYFRPPGETVDEMLYEN